MPLGSRCDDRVVDMPAVLIKPDRNDYLTDEESDEANDFEVKVPGLDALIGQFENDDDVIVTEKLEMKEFLRNEVSRGFQPEARHEIVDVRAQRLAMLDSNIASQRQLQHATMAGSMNDLNEVIGKNKNKLFLN